MCYEDFDPLKSSPQYRMFWNTLATCVDYTVCASRKQLMLFIAPLKVKVWCFSLSSRADVPDIIRKMRQDKLDLMKKKILLKGTSREEQVSGWRWEQWRVQEHVS